MESDSREELGSLILADQLNKANEEIERLNQQLMAAENEAAQLESDVAELKAENEALKCQVEWLWTERIEAGRLLGVDLSRADERLVDAVMPTTGEGVKRPDASVDSGVDGETEAPCLLGGTKP